MLRRAIQLGVAQGRRRVRVASARYRCRASRGRLGLGEKGALQRQPLEAGQTAGNGKGSQRLKVAAPRFSCRVVGRLCGLRFFPVGGGGASGRWLPHLPSAGGCGGLALSPVPADGYPGVSGAVFGADLLGHGFFRRACCTMTALCPNPTTHRPFEYSRPWAVATPHPTSEETMNHIIRQPSA